VLEQLEEIKDNAMTEAEKIAQVESDLTAVKGDFTTLSAGISDLKTQIIALQAQIGQGDPAVSAALDKLVTDSDALKVVADTAAASVPTPPPATPPTPPVV
jgi:predicted  nucleic acid-binding Zn-ribbon protein